MGGTKNILGCSLPLPAVVVFIQNKSPVLAVCVKITSLGNAASALTLFTLIQCRLFRRVENYIQYIYPYLNKFRPVKNMILTVNIEIPPFKMFILLSKLDDIRFLLMQ
jgi:hypothetical protein